jgi:PAP2 superfamily protein
MNRFERRWLASAVILLALVLASFDVRASTAARESEVVRTWQTRALDAVRTARASDAQAARLYAMVGIAMYDAVNGVLAKQGRSERAFALVSPSSAARDADPMAAAAAAAHAVLAGLYPDQAARFDEQLKLDLAARGTGAAVSRGQKWGKAVASDVLAARATDGSSPAESEPAGSGVGKFRASWTGAEFRNLAPFAIVDANAYVSAGPPALGSLDYAAAVAEVKLLGDAAVSDPAKLALFQFWNLPAGSDQPAGAWIQIALAVTEKKPLRLSEATRLFALLGMAMADTVAPTYGTKKVYNLWRPATAIREADTDDNPGTTAQADWSPRSGGIGGNPEHWSGHSAFSAAAAEVLAGFFCNDAIPFSLVSDSSPNQQLRSYTRFSEAAAEAGLSRVVGGLHFQFSNQAGLGAGRAIGAEVLTRKLLLKRGPTHFGACPL